MTEGNGQRRLAAIMFCDIKGYTALVQKDEGTALRKVSQFRKGLEDNTATHNGEVIEFYGDGSLSVYQSVVDAIQCAIKMQEVYRGEDEVPVRIGIHFGDIVFKDGTVYGDGVNLASRIESAGVPGAILISDKVHKELSNHPEIETKSMGLFSLKNVKEKIEIHAIDHPSVLLPKNQIERAHRAKNIQFIKRGLLGILVLSAIVLVARTVFLSSNQGQQQSVLSDIFNEKIAVSKFQNNTFIDSLNLIGDLAGDYLTRELLKTEKANVIAYRTQSELENSGILLASPSGTNKIDQNVVFLITGSYRIHGSNRDSMIFSASVEDNSSGEIMHGFDDQVSPLNDPFLALQKLDNQIKGFWESKNEKLSTPPNFEAYKSFLRAREAWFSDVAEVEKELKNAIRLDSSFTDPYFYLFTRYYDVGKYQLANEILSHLKTRTSDFTQRQKKQVYQMDADITGDNKLAYEFFLEEYQQNPQDIFLNGAAMAYAIDYVNAPDQVIEIFEQIPVDNVTDYSQCSYCLERLHIAQLAYTKLGKLQKARNIIDRMPDQMDYDKFYMGQVKYYAHRGDTAGISQVIRNLFNSGFDSITLNVLQFIAAREFKLLDQTELATYYSNLALNSLRPELYYIKGELLDLKNDYQGALSETEILVERFKDYQPAVAKLGVLYARLGMQDKASMAIERLASFEKTYSFGLVPYQQGVIYAHLGDTKTALNKVDEAIRNGCKFLFFNRFETDPDLMILHDNPRFKKLMNPLES